MTDTERGAPLLIFALSVGLSLATWLVLEIVLLVKRGMDHGKTPTISMVLRDAAWHTSSVVYSMTGLLCHWWIPLNKDATAEGTVLFWVIALFLLAKDIATRGQDPKTWPVHYRWFCFPPVMMLVGAVAAVAFFPQRGMLP